MGGFVLRHPEDEFYHVSHETIYRSLFVQARSVLKKERLNHLRSKRTIRRSKRADPNGDRRGQIKDIVSISARPAAASVSSWPPLRRRARPDAHFILSVVA
jgi:IS30 family transposase